MALCASEGPYILVPSGTTLLMRPLHLQTFLYIISYTYLYNLLPTLVIISYSYYLKLRNYVMLIIF